MDINIKKFRSDFFANGGFPVDEQGMMLVEDIRKLISQSKEMTLTPGEINLILGLAGRCEDGKIDVSHF